MLKKILIPAILASDKKQLASKIEDIEEYIEHIQIDYMDGSFVPQKTVFTPNDLKKINTVAKQEVHLMINHPENVMASWISAGVEKLIIHAEAQTDWQKVDKIYQENFIKLYIAINPDTPLNILENKISNIDGVTIMGVTPGKSNQTFQPKILGKIQTLRNRYPKLNIQVDGGMHLRAKNTIESALQAGANEIVCGSEIFIAKDPAAKIEELEFFIGSFNK